MNITLDTKIEHLNGVGPKTSIKLNKLGIETVIDLIFYYPRAYKDFTKITPIKNVISTPQSASWRMRAEKSYVFKAKGSLASLEPPTGHSTLRDEPSGSDSKSGLGMGRDDNREYTIRGRIIGIGNKKTSRRRIAVTEAVVEDDSGSIKIVWFNQPFLTKMLTVGREVILNGKIEYNFFSKEVVMESPERTLKPCIVPVYGETAGITSKYISRLVLSIKEQVSGIKEWLPDKWLCHSEPEFSGEESQGPFAGDQGDNKKSGDNKKRAQDDHSFNLLPIQKALLNIHFPENSEIIGRAQRRIAFDELFMVALRANLSKEELKKENAPVISMDDKNNAYATFLSSLSFELTGDQKKAVDQILKDMGGDTSPQPSPCKGEGVTPMNRLLNGDVGSGKTIVAAIAAYAAVGAGFRVAVMCPTEILAQQHFKTFRGLFKDHNVSVGVYTANFKDNFQFKISNLKSISNSQIINKKQKESDVLNSDIIIGTHALIQKGVELKNLGLVVVDEQHRFGVKQRAALSEFSNSKFLISNQNPKSKIQNTPTFSPVLRGSVEGVKDKTIKRYNNEAALPLRPHFLSMTATPIPRTLHLALFGDLDLSVIQEKPKDRKEIKTRFVEPKNREKAYNFIRAHIESGRQAFVICPLIEDKEISNDEFLISNKTPSTKLQAQNLFEQDRKSVKVEYEKLKKIYPKFRIGMLHGKMKGKEKDGIMDEFSKNEINILVSTSVVEVGIDIPNATVMMVEDAEHFGLAQIHQFRGRVGRGEHQSFCFLFSSTMSPAALERMRSLEMTSDGFRLAEIDLEQRGPGAVFGTEQSGMLDLKMANFSDRILIEEASSAAKKLVELDPNLANHPLLKDKIKDFIEHKHFE